jgi:hypothetical protein
MLRSKRNTSPLTTKSELSLVLERGALWSAFALMLLAVLTKTQDALAMVCHFLILRASQSLPMGRIFIFCLEKQRRPSLGLQIQGRPHFCGGNHCRQLNVLPGESMIGGAGITGAGTR